jgi:hypothetical protein
MLLGFKKGCYTMNNTRYLKQKKSELRHISKPRIDITDKAESLTEPQIRKPYYWSSYST